MKLIVIHNLTVEMWGLNLYYLLSPFLSIGLTLLIDCNPQHCSIHLKWKGIMKPKVHQRNSSSIFSARIGVKKSSYVYHYRGREEITIVTFFPPSIDLPFTIPWDFRSVPSFWNEAKSCHFTGKKRPIMIRVLLIEKREWYLHYSFLRTTLANLMSTCTIRIYLKMINTMRWRKMTVY